MTQREQPNVAVIVVAAGSGTRLGSSMPKAFVELGGVSLLARALHSVFGMQRPAQVIVVAPQSFLELAEVIAAEAAARAVGYVDIVPGGESRQASVAAGLAVVLDSVQIVLVHDAARALTPAALFDAVVAEVDRRGHGVIPGLPVSDTIKRTDATGDILETVDRSELSAIQTPQGFPRDQLLTAYATAVHDVTDDAALVTHAGFPVSVVAGDALAFKITSPWDLRRAEDLVAPAILVPKVGTGSDTHAFDPSAELWLAGLHWPGESGLAGHSDGDAVAHAITDALLSAAGLGDIGSVFGTSDPDLQNAHADVFLSETRRLIEQNGMRIGNVSAQIIGNRPRFSARRVEAEATLADILGAPVSLSATTTDGLGFTGRDEGISVLATALVYPT